MLYHKASVESFTVHLYLWQFGLLLVKFFPCQASFKTPTNWHVAIFRMLEKYSKVKGKVGEEWEGEGGKGGEGGGRWRGRGKVGREGEGGEGGGRWGGRGKVGRGKVGREEEGGGREKVRREKGGEGELDLLS